MDKIFNWTSTVIGLWADFSSQSWSMGQYSVGAVGDNGAGYLTGVIKAVYTKNV